MVLQNESLKQGDSENEVWQRRPLKEFSLFFASIVASSIGITHSESSSKRKRSWGRGHLWPTYFTRVDSAEETSEQ